MGLKIYNPMILGKHIAKIMESEKPTTCFKERMEPKMVNKQKITL